MVADKRKPLYNEIQTNPEYIGLNVFFILGGGGFLDYTSIRVLKLYQTVDRHWQKQFSIFLIFILF